MTFGFPAYAEAVERYDASGGELMEAVEQALEELGWSTDHSCHSSVSARVGVNFWSWGERVSIDVRDGKVRVRSQCALPTQCFDWGKNEQNVDRFLRRLDKILRRAPARRGARQEEQLHEQAIQPKPGRGVRKGVPHRSAAPPSSSSARPRTRPRDDSDSPGSDSAAIRPARPRN